MGFQKVFNLVFIFLFISLLASCSSSNSDNPANGSVSLLITDGITTDFDQVNLTVESISFLGENDARQTTVFDKAQVINLLALQNYSDLLTTKMVPAGIYHKIRLHVSQVELVKLNPDASVLSSDIAKLPANGKVDLNPRVPFVVTGGEHLMIELDVDAEKSIHIVNKGNGKLEYNFRPVVFVNILGDERLKLVLVDGKVLAKTESSFQLCDIQVTEVNDSCVEVLITQDSVVQDNMIAAVAASSIVNDDIVTVLGKAGAENISALHIIIAASNGVTDNLALIKGRATSVVDVVNSFGMTTVDGNGGLAPATALPVTLAESARIFDKYGVQAGAEVIADGVGVDAFGLARPELASVADVVAAFVIYDNEISNVTISGAVIDNNSNSITVNTGDGLTECADVTSAKIIYLSNVNGILVQSELTVNELALDMVVTVYGTGSVPGCIAAKVVLAIDNTLTTP